MNNFSLTVQTETKNIDFLNRVMEGYDYLCTVTTINAKEGLVRLWGVGKIGPVKRVLKGLPFTCLILEEKTEEASHNL